MVSATVKLLEKPTDDQIDQAVEVCVRAFAGDVCLRSMTADNHALESSLFRMMICAAALEGTVYCVTDDRDDKILSLGVWFGPGSQLLHTEAQRATGWNDFFASLSEEGQKWWATTFQTCHEDFVNSLFGDQYLGGWWANVIATHPDYQRQGHGTALVRAVLDQAQKGNKPVGLATQTEMNRDWYQTLGFKVCGETRVPEATRSGSFPDFVMKWEPVPNVSH
ncbi:hypothetical protein C8J56DRAFT_923170 [Mycena floridula]|nr:hypothetical protein C8J56DRAFT_923170 [Mycena floridula]